MRKIVSSVAVIFGVLLCGCSANQPEGYGDFVKAREEYEKLDSARVTMVDLDSGEQIMEFVFYITESDEMVFSYRDTWGGQEQQAFSDGAEFFYKEYGDEKWTVISSADENYIYNIYNREYRYPYAEGRIFFISPESVEQAAVSGGEGEPVTITYVYDAEKLNSASITGVFEEISSFNSLTTILEIGADGIITGFTESGSVITTDGEELTLNMRINVTDVNEITEIANPVDEVWAENEKPVSTSEGG